MLVKEHIFGKVTGLKTEPKFRPSKALGLIEHKYMNNKFQERE